MTKIRSKTDLVNFLHREMSWRKKELTNLKLLHDSAREHQTALLRRAGIALLYAHWEGFVKEVGTAYVEFVARQGLQYRQLRPNFSALGMKEKVLQAHQTIRGKYLVEIVEFLLTKSHEKAELKWKGAIQTKFNLSSDRLRDILAILGLDYSPFQIDEKPVIDRLLDQRNQIAHGNYLEVDIPEYNRLHEKVIAMFEELSKQITNSSESGTYRMPSSP